jgi:hypothetical protein
MPSLEFYQDLGALQAEVEILKKQREEDHKRIDALENDKIRLTTIGGVVAFALTALGVLFADPIRAFGARLLH